MQYTIYICSTSQAQTSTTMAGAIAGVVHKLNQALGLYEQGNFLSVNTLEQLLEVCDSHDWELRLVAN